MQRTHILLLSFWLCLATSTSSALNLNPIDWIFNDDDELPALRIASAAEEAEAASMLATGKAKLNSGSKGSANRIFKKLIKEFPKAQAAGEARFLRARVLMTKGHWKKAFNTLQDILIDNPNYKEFDQVIGAQFECATALMEGARGRLLWVIPGFKQYSEAVRQFEQIVGNAPYGDYAPLSLMNIAIVSERQNKPEIAIDALDRIINYYPQNMLAPDAYYNMAETYANLVKGAEYDQGSTRQAISYYEDFLILFPQSNYLGEVEASLESMENLLSQGRLNLGDFYYYYQDNNTAALIFYNEAITVAPESESAAEARLRIADIEAGVRPTSGASLLRKLLLAD